MSACQQCGGLVEVDVSHGRSTRRVPCRCLRDRVAVLERELAELRALLLATVPEPLDHRPVVAPELGHDGAEGLSSFGGERLK